MGKAKMSNDSLWRTVLGEVELSVSRGSFVTWFKNTTLLKCGEDAVIIGVPSVFIKNQLERKYAVLLQQTLEKNGITNRELIFKIHSFPIAGSPRHEDEPSFASPATVQNSAA